MNLFNKKQDKLNRDEAIEVLQSRPTISDSLMERDRFFHSCWMELKYRIPDIAKEMQDVELYICGYDLKVNEQNNTKGLDNDKRKFDKAKIL